MIVFFPGVVQANIPQLKAGVVKRGCLPQSTMSFPRPSARSAAERKLQREARGQLHEFPAWRALDDRPRTGQRLCSESDDFVTFAPSIAHQKGWPISAPHSIAGFVSDRDAAPRG